MLIPVETLFLITLHSSASVIVAVHVDESVTFAKLCRGCADKVDASPGGVSHQIHAIHDSLFHLADVISEISDAVIVFYGHLAICTLNQLIKRTKTILHDKQWFLVAVPECVQNIAKSLRIDLPAPVAGFQIRVWHTAQKISLGHFFPDLLWHRH